MASRKGMWDTLVQLEGKKVGSSHAALNKERVRQGYKSEGTKHMNMWAKHRALKKKTK